MTDERLTRNLQANKKAREERAERSQQRWQTLQAYHMPRRTEEEQAEEDQRLQSSLDFLASLDPKYRPKPKTDS